MARLVLVPDVFTGVGSVSTFSPEACVLIVDPVLMLMLMLMLMFMLMTLLVLMCLFLPSPQKRV